MDIREKEDTLQRTSDQMKSETKRLKDEAMKLKDDLKKAKDTVDHLNRQLELAKADLSDMVSMNQSYKEDFARVRWIKRLTDG